MQVENENNSNSRTGAPAQRGVISSFADWRFEQYLTMRLLPLFYLLLVLGALAVIAGLVAITFYVSFMAGLM